MGSQQLTLDSAALAQYRGAPLADALAARLGLYLKNYGPGQLATLSMRGTAAGHVAVLWNGLNVSLPTLGQTDFALLPVGATTEVSVQPGPAAALYGSGAVGGAVVLRQPADWHPGRPHGSLQADAGSFGLRGGSVEARAATPRLALRVAASYRQALNDYPYWVREPAGLVRYTLLNGALRHQWSLSPDLTWRVGAAGELTAAAWFTDTDRQIQSGTGVVGARAEQRDQSRRLTLAYRQVRAGGGQWSVRGAWFDDVLNYGENNSWSNSRVRTSQTQADYTAPLGPRASLRLGLEAQHFAARVDDYGDAPLTENRAAAFALLRLDPRPALRLSANLRQAALPAGLAPLTPTLGLEWDLFPSQSAPTFTHSSIHAFTARASAARTYRAPTLNERYWQPGGNPALRPESGQGFELGLRHRFGPAARPTFETELTAFRQLVDDWVQWLPLGAGGAYSPRNLRQVRSQGLEASTSYAWGRGGSESGRQLNSQPTRYQGRARLAYALTQTEKTRGTADDPDPTGLQLAFVPRHRVSVSTDHGWRGWLGSATYQFASYVFTNASASPFLPSTHLLGATLGRTLAWPGAGAEVNAGPSLTLLLQGSNLLNLSYESYPGRPAPPRAAVISLRLNY